TRRLSIGGFKERTSLPGVLFHPVGSVLPAGSASEPMGQRGSQSRGHVEQGDQRQRERPEWVLAVAAQGRSVARGRQHEARRTATRSPSGGKQHCTDGYPPDESQTKQREQQERK